MMCSYQYLVWQYEHFLFIPQGLENARSGTGTHHSWLDDTSAFDLQSVPGASVKYPAVQFQCHLCSKVLETRSGYKRHIQTHIGQFRFVCPKCGKGFQQRSHYDGHLNMHDNKTPFGCRFCGKKFNIKHNAMYHEKNCQRKVSLQSTSPSDIHGNNGFVKNG